MLISRPRIKVTGVRRIDYPLTEKELAIVQNGGRLKPMNAGELFRSGRGVERANRGDFSQRTGLEPRNGKKSPYRKARTVNLLGKPTRATAHLRENS